MEEPYSLRRIGSEDEEGIFSDEEDEDWDSEEELTEQQKLF